MLTRRSIVQVRGRRSRLRPWRGGDILSLEPLRQPFTASALRYPRLRPGALGLGARSPVISAKDSHIPKSSKPTLRASEDGVVPNDSTAPGDGPAAVAPDTTRTKSENQEESMKKQKKTPPPTLTSAHDIWRAQSIHLQSSYFTQSPVLPATTSKKAKPRPSSSSPSSPSTETAPPDSTIVLTTSPSPALAASTAFFTSHRSTHLYSASTLRTHRRNSAVPEIALVGASNCGKSTFLNALVRQPGLARTSARAGHTTTLNAYAVGPAPSAVEGAKMKARVAATRGESVPAHSMVLVDTPGYGFRSRNEWGEAIVGYLRGRTMLRGVVCLVAVEKDGVSRLDRDVLRMVASLGRKVLVVLTKGDKLARDAVAGKGKNERKVATGNKKKNEGREGEVNKKDEEENRLHAWTKEKMEDAARAVVMACRDATEGTLVPRVYLTAADMDKADRSWKTDPQGGHRGMAGVRLAILEMADISVQAEGRAKTKSKDGKRVEDIPPEARAEESTPEVWGGETISFEDLEKMYRSK